MELLSINAEFQDPLLRFDVVLIQHFHSRQNAAGPDTGRQMIAGVSALMLCFALKISRTDDANAGDYHLSLDE